MWIRAAVSEFETKTRWRPFLQEETEDEVRSFDAPCGSTLYPGVGLLSVTSLSVGDTPLTVNEGFWLRHKIADGPWLAVEFATGWSYGVGFGYGPDYRKVEITGRFGYCTELPPDVELAILSHAAAAYYQWLDSGSAGAIKREKAGPVEVEFAVEAGRDRGSMARKTFDDVVRRYRRHS
jgi:hypothetical protein